MLLKSSAISELRLDSGPIPGVSASPVSAAHPYVGVSKETTIQSLSHGSYTAPPAPSDGYFVPESQDMHDAGSRLQGVMPEDRHPSACPVVANDETSVKVQDTSSQTSLNNSSNALPPSPAASTDGLSQLKLQDDKASQTPEKVDVIPIVGLATPPTPVRQLKVPLQTLVPSRKRSSSEMEAEDAQMVNPGAAPLIAASQTNSTGVSAPHNPIPSERPPKRRFLQRLGFTAGVVVGAAGMFGTLLMLGDE